MVHIYFLHQTELDLEEIREPLTSQILAKINVLAQFPHLGPVIDGEYTEFRILSVGIARVIYTLTEQGDIEISYIRHERRDISGK